MFDWATIFSSFVTMTLTVLISVLVLVFIIWKSIVAMGMKPVTGAKQLIGMKGIATTDIAPQGIVLADGTRWQALAEDESISKGESVEIVAVEKLHITVKKADG